MLGYCTIDIYWTFMPLLAVKMKDREWLVKNVFYVCDCTFSFGLHLLDEVVKSFLKMHKAHLGI